MSEDTPPPPESASLWDTFKKPRDVRDTEHYAALGSVAAFWALFEAIVDRHTHALVGLPHQRGVCLTAQLAGIGRKLDAYIALATLIDIPPDLAKALRKFADDSASLAEQRNRCIHVVWIM
jgi:hypothetical protein